MLKKTYKKIMKSSVNTNLPKQKIKNIWPNALKAEI